MAKEPTFQEQLAQEREVRQRLMEKASAGDREAQETLAAAPEGASKNAKSKAIKLLAKHLGRINQAPASATIEHQLEWEQRAEEKARPDAEEIVDLIIQAAAEELKKES